MCLYVTVRVHTYHFISPLLTGDIIVHNSMFVTVGYLGTLKCRGTVYLGAEGTMERKELGSLLQINPFCAEKSSIPLSTNKAIMAGFLSSRGCVD